MAEAVKTAYVFPGQGAQWVGMGKDLCESSNSARAVFKHADEALGFPISQLCFDGSEEELRLTINVQPAIVTFSLALLAAIKDTEFAENTKRIIAKERTRFVKMLSEIGGFHVFPSETNFLLLKILNKKITATALKEKMAKEGILIRDCSTFVGLDDSYFRVTVRSSTDNLKLIKTLKEIINKKSS